MTLVNLDWTGEQVRQAYTIEEISRDDLLHTIVHVLHDEAARAELRASLATHAERSSTTRFQQQIRAIVARHASGAS